MPRKRRFQGQGQGCLTERRTHLWTAVDGAFTDNGALLWNRLPRGRQMELFRGTIQEST